MSDKRKKALDSLLELLNREKVIEKISQRGQRELSSLMGTLQGVSLSSQVRREGKENIEIQSVEKDKRYVTCRFFLNYVDCGILVFKHGEWLDLKRSGGVYVRVVGGRPSIPKTT